MEYKITVAYKTGEQPWGFTYSHMFTAGNIRDQANAEDVYWDLKSKYPEPEYNVTCTRWITVGTEMFDKYKGEEQQYVVTSMNAEERGIEDSLDIRGPYKTRNEARRAMVKWSDDLGETGMELVHKDLLMYDDCSKIYMVHQLYKD